MNEDDEWRIYIELARKQFSEDEMYELFGAEAEPDPIAPIKQSEPDDENTDEEIPF